MPELGFTTYVQPAPPTPPTLAERFAALSGSEKLAILDGLSAKIIPNNLKAIAPIPKDLIQGVYLAIDAIEELSRLLMREEVLIEEGTYDPETGEEITPPVYNEAPATIADLKAEIILNSEGLIFTPAEIEMVIDRMILYSEINEAGTPIGTAAIYAAEVVK